MRPADRDDLFGEPEIAWPGEQRASGHRARDAQLNLDLDLGRIKRRKRYGIAMTLFSVLFVAFILAPVTWVAVYRVVDPPGNAPDDAARGRRRNHSPPPSAHLTHVAAHRARGDRGGGCQFLHP